MSRTGQYYDYLLKNGSNKTVAELVDELKAEYSTITAACRKLKVKPKPAVFVGPYDEYILAHHKTETLKQMADGCNALPGAIGNVCVRLGVKAYKKTAKPKPEKPLKKRTSEHTREYVEECLRRDPKIIDDILDDLATVAISSKPKKKRPKSDYNQGGSYLKILNKYSSK